MMPPIRAGLWMAPELCTGRKPSLHSDVFSFGLIMYAVVTGLVPYGLEMSEIKIMMKKLSGEPPCTVTHHHCPRELCELMSRCVAISPGDRPTMSDVAECLSMLPRYWQAGQ